MSQLFIFKKDLKFEENKGVNYCLQHYKKVMPIFIYNNKQLKHKYTYQNAINYIIKCVKDINVKKCNIENIALNKKLKNNNKNIFLTLKNYLYPMKTLPKEISINKYYKIYKNNIDFTPLHNIKYTYNIPVLPLVIKNIFNHNKNISCFIKQFLWTDFYYYIAYILKIMLFEKNNKLLFHTVENQNVN